jgi:aryl-alcohol dehydrogenase-like predicted oxidoreductase
MDYNLILLYSEGKIKYIGLSTVSSTTLRRACKIGPVAAVQIEYSAFTRDIEGSESTYLLQACRELGVAVVVSSPLGRGLLTASFGGGQVPKGPDDMRSNVMPRFHEKNLDHNFKIIAKFKALAEKKHCTVSQLAIAWVLKQGNDIIPIPGTKRIPYLEENWSALKISLTDDEEAEIRTLAEGSRLAGGAAPPAFVSYAFRDTKEETSS